MNILVFGANGMLGRYVCSRLSQEHTVKGLTRKDLDVSKVDQTLLPYILKNTVSGYDAVINCAGIIKSRADISAIEFIIVNSVFPRILADVCKKANIKMFHISTDCVYDGFSAVPYVETDHHTAADVYGKTKSLGESEDCCVIRTSIVGEEVGQTRSLISWAKSKKGQPVMGFTNHWWNGVSCLQLSDFLSLLIKYDLYWSGVRHVYSPNIVTKCELLEIINSTFDLGLTVVPSKSGDLQPSCNRALDTDNEEWRQYLQKNIPEIKDQLVKMRDFKLE